MRVTGLGARKEAAGIFGRSGREDSSLKDLDVLATIER